MTQEEIKKEARRNKPIATDGCILTNNGLSLGNNLCENVGISKKRADERAVGCQMFTEEKIIWGKTGIEKVFLQVEERHRRRDAFGGRWKEGAGRQNELVMNDGEGEQTGGTRITETYRRTKLCVCFWLSVMAHANLARLQSWLIWILIPQDV